MGYKLGHKRNLVNNGMIVKNTTYTRERKISTNRLIQELERRGYTIS